MAMRSREGRGRGRVCELDYDSHELRGTRDERLVDSG